MASYRLQCRNRQNLNSSLGRIERSLGPVLASGSEEATREEAEEDSRATSSESNET